MVLVGGLVPALSQGCWETSALLCTCVLGLGLAQPSEACSQPDMAGRGMWQVSRGCLVCLYRRESR